MSRIFLIKNNKITETPLWDYIKTVSDKKPVVLYGMGNGADKILDLCAEKNIKISAVFASDEFVRGHFFRGFEVRKISEISKIMQSDFCILVAFATREDEVINRIYELDKNHELYVPGFPVFGDNYFDFDFLGENIKSIEDAYSVLSDKESERAYIDAINFMISGKLKYLKNISSPKFDALDLLDLQNLNKDLCYIDVGAYNGDTVLELREYLKYKNINKVIALEPDKKNFEKLKINLKDLFECELYNIGAWSCEETLFFDSKSGRNSSFNIINAGNKAKTVQVNSLDNLLKSFDFNNINNKIGEMLIKYDVEGSEYEALIGSVEIIKKYSPKLIVSLYHRTEDIFKLLLLINSINADYDFYIRKHKYIPCWDLNLYAVPKK